MKCSRMHLSERRYKPPPRVSKCDSGGPIIRPCSERFALGEFSQRHRSRSCRSTSPQTLNSDHNSSSPDSSQKTPLIIVNLNIASDAKTLAPKNVKRSEKKLPPYCVQYQNSVKGNTMDESNMKVINDFIVQGTLIGYQRRSHATDDAFSPDIIVNCDDNEYDECDTMCESTINVFNNINTDLLLSLDYYEMDSFGRLPGDSRTPTPNPLSSANRATSFSVLSQSRTPTPTYLAVPAGYRPLSIRAPSPNTRTIIRVDLINRDNERIDSNIKDFDYNLHRLKEKRGIRSRDDINQHK